MLNFFSVVRAAIGCFSQDFSSQDFHLKMLGWLSNLFSWVSSQARSCLAPGSAPGRIGLYAGIGFLAVLLVDVFTWPLGELPERPAKYFLKLGAASVLAGTFVHYAEKDGLFSLDFSSLGSLPEQADRHE